MAAGLHPSRRDRRRGGAVLLLSVLAHAAVLGALTERTAAGPARAEVAAMEVSLAPAPLVRASPAPALPAPRPPVVVRVAALSPVAPRYAAMASAATGEAADAVDLFGPVYADGLWPRPVKVASAACDPEERERDPDCRREVMLIGLASGPAAGSKAAP
jgi:hypothetical protein